MPFSVNLFLDVHKAKRRACKKDLDVEEKIVEYAQNIGERPTHPKEGKEEVPKSSTSCNRD